MHRFIILISFLGLLAFGDSSTAQAASPQAVAAGIDGQQPNSSLAGDSATAAVPSDLAKVEQTVSEIEDGMGLGLFKEPRTGDLDEMVIERVVRVLTIYAEGRYFLQRGQEKGITYELLKMFEDFLNEKLGAKHLRTHVVFIPVARDMLIPALLGGRGDIIAAGMTITPEREELIDFTDPITKDIAEVLVTGPSAPVIRTLEDLAGRNIYVRASSSYRSSIEALNLEFRQKGLDEIIINDIAEQLEDMDVLEMVNAGLLEWAVVDDYKADLWEGVLEGLSVREDLVFRSGGRLGFGFRKNSPQLAAMLNEFFKTHKQGTLQGNILINRYLKDIDWARNALEADDYQRFQNVVDIFAKFGQQYGVDYLMVAAQGYQESRLDQNARSSAGAVGIMQLLPSTASDSNVGIHDIENAESNIHAGIKYLDFIRKRYFSDPGMDPFNQTMFAFAAYNAGPARIRNLRDKAAAQGYDPNVWFDNVEVIAAKEIGRETVQYVANILKYYIAYSLSLRPQLERAKSREEAGIK